MTHRKEKNSIYLSTSSVTSYLVHCSCLPLCQFKLCQVCAKLIFKLPNVGHWVCNVLFCVAVLECEPVKISKSGGDLLPGPGVSENTGC